MSTRINPDPYLQLLDFLAMDRQRETDAIAQLSSGLRVTSPSDDPIAVAALVQNRDRSDAADQFSRSISSVRNALQAGDSALNSVVQALSQAIALGLQGASGTTSSDQRKILASQVQNLEQEVLGLANTEFQGSYIFAGTLTTTQPFVADSGSPSGYKYVGNSETNNVAVGENQLVPMSRSGDSIFTSAGKDAFQALSDLVSALNTSGDISGATKEVQNAFDYVNVQRMFYGSTMQRLDTANSDISSEKLTLSTQENTLVAADPTKAASDLVQAETTLNAALAAGAKISQNSLLDYLK